MKNFFCTAIGTLKTQIDEFDVSTFFDGKEECVVLHMGCLSDAYKVYCRFHSQCFTGHVFQSIECDCNDQMRKAQLEVSRRGKGLIILLHQEGKGNGAVAHIASQNLKRNGISQEEAYLKLGYEADARDYSIAIKVLEYFNIKSVVMDTDNELKKKSLNSLGDGYLVEG
jgi:GTP cyclohydrolase II